MFTFSVSLFFFVSFFGFVIDWSFCFLSAVFMGLSGLLGFLQFSWVSLAAVVADLSASLLSPAFAGVHPLCLLSQWVLVFLLSCRADKHLGGCRVGLFLFRAGIVEQCGDPGHRQRLLCCSRPIKQMDESSLFPSGLRASNGGGRLHSGGFLQARRYCLVQLDTMTDPDHINIQSHHNVTATPGHFIWFLCHR